MDSQDERHLAADHNGDLQLQAAAEEVELDHGCDKLRDMSRRYDEERKVRLRIERVRGKDLRH